MERQMSNNEARAVNELVDAIAKGYVPNEEELGHLRSFLPERPKPVTLEQLRDRVHDAWMDTNVNAWTRKEDLDDFFLALRDDLIRLINEPKPPVPALPAGMRLAEHDVHGLCVVSPKADGQGLCVIMYLRDTFSTKADWAYEHESKLKFIDVEPAKPTHPEFLETEADYENAPVGTVVAEDKKRPVWKQSEHWFIDQSPFDICEISGTPRRVLRWGWGE